MSAAALNVGEGTLPAAATDERRGAVRILYVQERFPVLSETFVRNELARLRALGVATSVTTARRPLESWDPRAPLTAPGAPVGTSLRSCAIAHLAWVRRAPRRYATYLCVLAGAPLKDKPFVLLAPVIAQEALGESVTHVHTHFAFRGASVARGVATLLGVTRSVTTHANDIFVRSRFLRSRLRGARVLTISEHNREFLAARGISSTVNHCGIDLPEAPPAQRHARTTDVVFVGRLVTKKGPLELLAAVAELVGRGRRLTVRVVGDGPLREECEELACVIALPVTFLGSLDAEATLTEIRSARVLCLPCQVAPDGDVDGIPVVLMEAMANGTAVVTTRVSGIPELVDEGSGWLVEPGPGWVTELADAVEAALDGDDAERRTASARAAVTRSFTLDDQARGVLAAAGVAS